MAKIIVTRDVYLRPTCSSRILMAFFRDASTPPSRSGKAPGEIVLKDRTVEPSKPGPGTGRRSAYRADVDGLRAIAVTGVILMHAGITAVRGGFLGVDVFFVISGYLVHQQVATRLRTGSFSLRAFYARRIRRTFPALYVVSGVCLLAGAAILMPGDLIAFAHSVIAAGLGVSNILFATQSGYFDHDAVTKPLLHSWSLGVEEQFYLIAPLVPFLLRKLSDRTRAIVLLGLIIGDLAFCIIVQELIPQITFFMMPPRLWEFWIGSLVAERFMPKIERRWLAELVAAAALVLLFVSLLAISRHAAHPGLVTLLPCLATAALIHIGTTCKTLVGRLLGAAPLAFCGLISYSLYLWHWPLIVFALYSDMRLTPGVLALGAMVLLALSYLSWRFIETPFRDPASPLMRNAVAILPGSLAVLTAGSIFLSSTDGLPERFPPDVRAITSYYDYVDRRDFREGTCFITSKYDSARYFDRKACLAKSATKPNYLLIGDSHAAHFWAGFSRVFRKVHILQATASGCKPVLGTGGLRYCVDVMREALLDFLPKAKLDGVIISAAWDAEDVAAAKATVAYAERFAPHVILLGNIPTYQIALPNLLALGLIKHRPDLVFEHESDDPPDFDRLFRAAIDPAHYVSLVNLLCPRGRCIVYAGPNIPLQFDSSHLTTEGSILVAKKLSTLPQFAPIVDGRDVTAHALK